MLSVYYNCRFDNDFLIIKKLLGENRVGNVYVYELNFDCFCLYVCDWWREKNLLGFGILYDLGLYLID